MQPAAVGTHRESEAADDVMENSAAQVVTKRYSDWPHCYVLGKSSPIDEHYNNIHVYEGRENYYNIVHALASLGDAENNKHLPLIISQVSESCQYPSIAKSRARSFIREVSSCQ